jgi:hypothetical protein
MNRTLKLCIAVIIAALMFSLVHTGELPAARAWQDVTLVPGTVEVDRPTQEAIKAALARVPDLPGEARYFAVTDVQPVGRASFVSVIGLAELDAELGWSIDDGAWFGLLLVREGRNGQALAAPQGSEEFSSWLGQFTDEELGPSAKRDLDPLQSGRDPNLNSGNYVFPWQAGTSMLYGTLGVHDNGFASVVTGWKAVDMLSDGNTGAGHAPNRLLAAYASTISYRCNDGTSVAVRAGNFFYTHLVYNANLYVGKSFAQGQEMGQMKTGSFSASCGWATQGSGWFHVHWGFPNDDLQVEGWTLSMSTKNWTNGGATITPNGSGWIKAGEVTTCSPNSDQIALYEHTNYGGACKVLGVGDYGDPGAMGFANDAASSIKVGSAVKAILYSDSGYAGTSEEFSGDDSDLSNNAIGNDRVSSVKIQWRGCNPSADQIAIYEHSNYGGACKILGVGDYGDPGAMGFANDSVTSIKVGGNVKAILYSDSGYAGTSEEFTGDDSDLSNNAIGNDRVSSIKVQTRGCSPNSEQIALYEHPNYTGACKVLGVGEYGDPGAMGFANDTASSIKVGSNVKAVLYEHSGYAGMAEEFSADDSDFGDNAIGHDRVSSLKVQVKQVCSSNVPPKPTVVSPADGSNVNTTTPTLDWNDADASYCVDYYNLQIYEDGAGQVDISWPTGSSYTVPAGKLTQGKKYWWYVWAHNAAGFSEASLLSFWAGSPPSVTVEFKSNATYDGWILESSETSGLGGSYNSTGTAFYLGDNAADRQYRAILHFDTSSLPDNAVILALTLKIRLQGIAGTNPFTTHGPILVDIRKGGFGGSSTLASGDFQAAASAVSVGTIDNLPDSANWHSTVIGNSAFPWLNLAGATQFRLFFIQDDNDDLGADYLKFYSGNTSVTADRPTLIVQYYLP